MKYSIIAPGIAAMIITSCNNIPEKKIEAATTDTNSTIKSVTNKTKDSLILYKATGDNSFNALDWPGTYTGTIPCADCEGIETQITIGKDLYYSMKIKYPVKSGESVHENNGRFTWNKEGSTITLNGIENAPNQYLVGENILIRLDMKGNRITGKNASKYHLKKKVN